MKWNEWCNKPRVFLVYVCFISLCARFLRISNFSNKKGSLKFRFRSTLLWMFCAYDRQASPYLRRSNHSCVKWNKFTAWRQKPQRRYSKWFIRLHHSESSEWLGACSWMSARVEKKNMRNFPFNLFILWAVRNVVTISQIEWSIIATKLNGIDWISPNESECFVKGLFAYLEIVWRSISRKREYLVSAVDQRDHSQCLSSHCWWPPKENQFRELSEKKNINWHKNVVWWRWRAECSDRATHNHIQIAERILRYNMLR